MSITLSNLNFIIDKLKKNNNETENESDNITLDYCQKCLNIENYSQLMIFLIILYDQTKILYFLNKLLVESCRNGNIIHFKTLINLGISPLSDNLQSFFTACFHNHLEIVEIFLRDFEIKPNILCNKAIFIAVQNKNLHLLHLFQKYGADFNFSSGILSRICVVNNNYQILDFLIGIGLNFRSLNERSLFLAIKNNAVECVKILLENGANPNTITNIFSLAREKNNSEIIQLLEKYQYVNNDFYNEKNNN